MKSLLNIAKDYLNRFGFNVIPAKGKVPAVAWAEYQNRRITDKELSDLWFPEANIALITGSISKVVVLDADTSEAVRSLRARGLTKTAVVKTKRGFHYYFRTDKVIRSGKLKSIPSVDVKAEGSVVILPPSVHPDGGNYYWYKGLSPSNVVIASLPGWVAEEMEGSNGINLSVRDISFGVEEGTRNNALTKLIGIWFKCGFDYQEVVGLALVWNRLNSPPLREKEILSTVKSIYRRERDLRNQLADQIENISSKLKEFPDLVKFLTTKCKNENIAKRITIWDLLEQIKGGNNVQQSCNSR